MHLKVIVGCLVSCLAAAAQVRYSNPVIPGDHPDPSLIRVGSDYYATATTSEWAPLFPILHSRDLVNWTNIGAVFQNRPSWAVGNFWAPEIAKLGDTYFVYYVGRKKGGPLSIAVATASRPEGPYTDHGPLIGQDAGSIDAFPVEDENAKRYLIWKEDGNSRKQPTPLWIQELSPDGLKLVGQMQEILRNDVPWEGDVVEGPAVIRHNGYYYLFYAGNACCGRGCHYGQGVARARSLLGPWEKNPKNPIITANDLWKCPGHGSLAANSQGQFYLLYHAYHADDFVYVGRQAVLDRVDFSEDGWPVINQGRGTATSAPAPEGRTGIQPYDFTDEFDSPRLKFEWQWPQNSPPVAETRPANHGRLILRPDPNRADDPLGGVLAIETTSGQYTAETVLSRDNWAPGTIAGLSAFGDLGNALGVAYDGERIQLWRRAQKKSEMVASRPAGTGSLLYLRLVARQGHQMTFYVSADGQDWAQVASETPLEGSYLPPWDRGVRVALTVGGGEKASANFESFSLRSKPPRLQP